MTILGEPYVGETLIARPNSISDADGIDFASATYQWLRDGVEIPGAVQTEYLVSEADVAAQISVRFTYTDFQGTEEVVTSYPEDPVAAVGVSVPDDVQPYNDLVILGDAVVGESLTARPNAVTDENGIDPTSVSFQWLRDGEEIVGATGQVYDVTEDVLGAEISVVFAYTDLRGTDKSLTSNPKPAVEAALPDPIVLPDTDAGDASRLLGTTDDDTFTAAVGLRSISGFGETDTVHFEGDQSNYSLILSADSVSVSDRREDGLGTIILDTIELIDFGTEVAPFDGPVNLDVFAGHTELERAELESLIEMYIAYFNRAPDAIGLGFWGSAVAEGASFESVASLFAIQVETQDMYQADTTNIEFATAIYDNVLGRVPDQEGLEFWVNALDTNAVSRDQFILQVLEGVHASPKQDFGYEFTAQQLADQQYLETKVDIGALYAVHKGLSDVQDATNVMALFDGSQSSMNAAVAAINDHYMDAMDPESGEFVMQLVGVLDNAFTG